MGAGKYRDRALVEEKTLGSNEANQPTHTWEPVFRLWIEDVSASGGELLRGRDELKREAHITHLYRTRRNSLSNKLKPGKHRIRLDGSTLNIVRVNNVKGQHKERIIQCIEVD